MKQRVLTTCYKVLSANSLHYTYTDFTKNARAAVLEVMHKNGKSTQNQIKHNNKFCGVYIIIKSDYTGV